MAHSQAMLSLTIEPRITLGEGGWHHSRWAGPSHVNQQSRHPSPPHAHTDMVDTGQSDLGSSSMEAFLPSKLTLQLARQDMPLVDDTCNNRSTKGAETAGSYQVVSVGGNPSTSPSRKDWAPGAMK